MKGVKRKTGSLRQDPEALRKNIGAKLKKIRKELGYGNGDDFAYAAEINRSQYGKYEAGSQDIRLSTLLKIVNSMDLTLEEFFSKDFHHK
jgi:transcriptional regulator with XRE-family HTH domain